MIHTIYCGKWRESLRRYVGSGLAGLQSMAERHCSDNKQGLVDHSDHPPINICMLSGPTEVATLDEHHYFRSSYAEVNILMKYQLAQKLTGQFKSNMHHEMYRDK
jgi:hypothetical protein